jgi:hypothetical protein
MQYKHIPTSPYSLNIFNPCLVGSADVELRIQRVELIPSKQFNFSLGTFPKVSYKLIIYFQV